MVTVGIDLASNVFAVHVVDETGKTVLVRPEVARGKLLELIAHLPPCLIAREDAANRSHWRRANSTNPLSNTTGCDHGNGMESYRAVRIWGRAGSSATSPSVDVRPVPSLIAASNHRNAGIPFIKEEDQTQKTKSCA